MVAIKTESNIKVVSVMWNLTNICEPFYIRDLITNEKINISSVTSHVKLLKKSNYGNLNKLVNSLLLKDISNAKENLIFRHEDLVGYRESFAP